MSKIPGTVCLGVACIIFATISAAAQVLTLTRSQYLTSDFMVSTLENTAELTAKGTYLPVYQRQMEYIDQAFQRWADLHLPRSPFTMAVDDAVVYYTDAQVRWVLGLDKPAFDAKGLETTKRLNKRFPDTSYRSLCKTDMTPISDAELDDAAAHMTNRDMMQNCWASGSILVKRARQLLEAAKTSP